MRVHQTNVTMPVREAFGLTGKMFVQALPLAVLLFLFFPRLPGQFWAMPARSQATSGLSDEMSPGDVSDLSLSADLAFRARFEGELPPPRERYWRGPVLHDFDGRTWRRSNRVSAGATRDDVRPGISLSTHVGAASANLGIWARHADRMAAAACEGRSPTSSKLRPRATPISVVTAFELDIADCVSGNGPSATHDTQSDCRLTRGAQSRARALALQMRADSGTDEAFIQAVLNKFRSEEYFYTLEPPRLEVDSIDDFLFNTRRGFCEHFASAFTALARAAGIPARVVTGYQGGEYNSIGGYLIVRQSDAHAWSEVWLEGRGWVRIDPTAAVAPERIEQGLSAAMGEDEPVPGRLLSSNATLNQLRLLWDSVNAFWNDQVVEFGELQQRWLLEQLNIDEPGWETLGIAIALGLGAFFLR